MERRLRMVSHLLGVEAKTWIRSAWHAKKHNSKAAAEKIGIEYVYTNMGSIKI